MVHGVVFTEVEFYVSGFCLFFVMAKLLNVVRNAWSPWQCNVIRRLVA